jgi:hypothetical protein
MNQTAFHLMVKSLKLSLVPHGKFFNRGDSCWDIQAKSGLVTSRVGRYVVWGCFQQLQQRLSPSRKEDHVMPIFLKIVLLVGGVVGTVVTLPKMQREEIRESRDIMFYGYSYDAGMPWTVIHRHHP